MAFHFKDDPGQKEKNVAHNAEETSRNVHTSLITAYITINQYQILKMNETCAVCGRNIGESTKNSVFFFASIKEPNIHH